MKKLLSIVTGFLLVGTIAQAQDLSTVTLNVTGNRTKQVAVDNQTYTVENSTATSEASVKIPSMAAGQHSLTIYRSNSNYSNSTTPSTTTFTVRSGYDLTITINANGAVSLTEIRQARWGNNQGGWQGNAMGTNAFNKLYNATKALNSSSARTSYLRNQFEDEDRRLSSAQAKKLLLLVNSESSRLALAKLVYPLITDRANFAMVTNLLKSSNNRAQLNNYIATVDNSNTSTETNAAYVAMTNERFVTIYNEALAEPVSDRDYYLDNFFEKDFNYYSSAQARQLLQLVTNETERFNLAKVAYRGISDPNNYYNEVAPLLGNSYNRTNLRSYMNTYDLNNVRPGGGSTTLGMSSAAYTNLYNTISYQNTTSRYNSLYSAFTSQANSFTAAQARQLITLVTDENSRLTLAKLAYSRLVDKANYTLFNDLFNYQASRNDFNNFVMNNANGTGENPGMVMSDSEFNTLYSNVNNAWTSANKYSLVSNAFQGTTTRFGTSQIRQLLLAIANESDRLALAKMAYDNMVDPYGYTQIADVFTSVDNRTNWTNYVLSIQNGGTGTTYKVAMTDSEYKSLYRSVQYTFGLGAKQSSLRDIFNKETNYFTSAQAKELIRLVSSESNRLELAKLAYNNIVDPTTYASTLNDIWTIQSNRDELEAYIKANSYNN